MSALVNPADSLPSFQEALTRGVLTLQKCVSDPHLYVHADHPTGGDRRLTYARIEDGVATALAIYFVSEPLNGLPCFQVGWAVPVKFRNQGRAKATVQASLAEMELGFAKQNIIPEFYVEAVVGIDNVASQKVAAANFNGNPESGNDKLSSEAVLHYVKKIDGYTY